MSRIFSINPEGELSHELDKDFQATYWSMSSIVDHVFPAVSHFVPRRTWSTTYLVPRLTSLPNHSKVTEESESTAEPESETISAPNLKRFYSSPC